MTKRLVGTYETEEHALRAIDGLAQEGYLSKDILIFTTNKDADNLKGSTDAFVESGEAESEDTDKPSFMDKIKSALPLLKNDPEEPSAVKTRLIELGVPEEEASKYAPSGESGSIFIIVEEDPDGTASGGTSKVKLVAKETESPVGNVNAEEDKRVEPTISEDTLASARSQPEKPSDPKSDHSFTEQLNPSIDNKTVPPAERAEDPNKGKSDAPVTSNPPVSGVDDSRGDAELELGHDDGVPKDHSRTPLDKTEEDINESGQKRRAPKKNE